MAPTPLYLEDFSPGQTFASPSATMDAAAIKAYARQFDLQPFHLDEATAAGTFFKGLAASGWHTVLDDHAPSGRSRSAGCGRDYRRGRGRNPLTPSDPAGRHVTARHRGAGAAPLKVTA